MGKQNRRKRQKQKCPKGSAAAAAAVSKVENISSSTLLLRVRHADARTRHAALTALSVTLLDPEELLRSQQKARSVSNELLQAVRERVMDTDLECAQAAAGCLANFCNFSTQSNKHTITSGWTVVLLGRLQQCRDALLKHSKDDTNNAKKNAASHKQWWALTMQCLHALCALIEFNPEAIDRLGPVTSTESSSSHFIGLLLNLLSAGCNSLGASCNPATNVATPTPTPTQSINEKKEQEEWVRDVTVYAARTLHSALDDNLELLQPWLDSNESAVSMEGLRLLQSSCTHNNLPASARLHAAGCLVTARQLLVANMLPHTAGTNPNNYNVWINELQLQVKSTVVPVLHQYLDYRSDIAKALLERLVQAQREWEKEEADDAMEREIIQNVNGRKEPARRIARRQKDKKELKKNSTDGMDEEDTTDNNGDDTDKDARTTECRNVRETMERTRQAWHDALCPLQLALEVSANLTSILPYPLDGDNMDEGEIPMDEDDEWGPDQEAQLMAQSLQSGRQQQLTYVDEELVKFLVETGLPDRLVVLLQAVCTPLVQSADEDDASGFPPGVKGDMSQVQSKCSGCLANCLANLPSWKASDPSNTWKELRQASQNLATNLNSDVNSDGLEGICSAMVVALQSRPTLRTQMQEGDLDFLLMLLHEGGQKESIQRDASCMLGILCSTEPHPASVNSKVCSALLASLKQSKSAMVMSEILNSLMDMYSDNNHTHVFDSFDVLGNFQMTVPILKKRIHAERADSPEDEVEQWKEIGLNASRFVQYKKGQLRHAN